MRVCDKFQLLGPIMEWTDRDPGFGRTHECQRVLAHGSRASSSLHAEGWCLRIASSVMLCCIHLRSTSRTRSDAIEHLTSYLTQPVSSIGNSEHPTPASTCCCATDQLHSVNSTEPSLAIHNGDRTPTGSSPSIRAGGQPCLSQCHNWLLSFACPKPPGGTDGRGI